MTQPNDQTEALRTHRLPVDAAATARLDGLPHPTGPTAHPASDEPTAHVGAGEPTAHLASDEPTAHLGSGEPTAYLAAGESTAYLGSGEPTAYLGSGEPTAYLGSGEPTAPMAGGAPTMRHPAAGHGTTHLAQGEATAHLNLGNATGHLGGAEPTAHLAPGWRVAPPAGPVPAPPGGPVPSPRVDPGRLPMDPGGRSGPWTTAQPSGQEPTGPVTAVGTGRTTGTGPGTVIGGRTEASPAPAGGEVRFGPGVPAAPPVAPAWPVPTPPRRRRSAWRIVTSALSTVLTVALLVAVGRYLWQRISPLEVTGVTVAVPRPAGDRCDVTVDVVATVSTNGRAGEIRYQWLRSGSTPGSLLTERVGRGQRTVELTLRWAFSGVGATTETATVNITSPSPVQAQAPVAYDCRRR
ncbi:hypothetical protein ABZ793_10050 [Micromonospora sp. NPDC047465]|uniref:hypothetical protein n=1 Tax=Micromonospora sp. NPDC047465 TaxID=3154813 RepID=UPI0033F8435F